MTEFRNQLIRIHKQIYRQNVRRVRKSLGYDPGVEIYAEDYSRYLKTYEKIADKTELVKKVLAADLVFHGDYHTLKQSQLCVLSILREIEDKRDIILCLEMFHGSDQKLIDQFLFGDLSEKLFLKKIDYAAKWLPGSFGFHNTPRKIPADLLEPVADEVRDLAVRAWRALECRDYARVDFRLDEHDRPYVLEVNPNPDISKDAGFAAALTAGGMDYPRFVWTMLKNAAARRDKNGIKNCEC